MDKTQNVLIWMMFLLAGNTGVVLTLLRERIVFRRIRDEIAGFLPKGYDPKRLDYPYIFPFTTPPAWSRALLLHVEAFPEHPIRASWERFLRIRNVLMVGEALTIVGFVGWMLLS
ncbi:MAG: hypothetical protein ABIQ44_13330 [Chloroflexia bacterium]